MADRILVFDMRTGFVGWFLNKTNTFATDGIDIICRPLGLNPISKFVIRNVSPKSIKTIEKTKVSGSYDLMLLVSEHGVIPDAIKEMNTELLSKVEELTERLKISENIARSKELQHKMDIKTEVKEIHEIAKKISPTQKPFPLRRQFDV